MFIRGEKKVLAGEAGLYWNVSQNHGAGGIVPNAFNFLYPFIIVVFGVEVEVFLDARAVLARCYPPVYIRLS